MRPDASDHTLIQHRMLKIAEVCGLLLCFDTIPVLLLIYHGVIFFEYLMFVSEISKHLHDGTCDVAILCSCVNYITL